MPLERLMYRYQDALGATCLRLKERSWLEVVFKKFAKCPGYWSQSDLIDVLSLSFPDQSKRLLREAGPTLYQIILRIGSYPYHQNPRTRLDLGTLRTAIIILLGSDERKLRGTGADEEDAQLATQLQARYSRLLFQSIAPSPGLDFTEMAADNDEDVVESLRIISKQRILRHPTEPKIGIPAPKLPQPSLLPSSHDRDLNGHISKADLEGLIRILLACQLHWAGCGPERVIASSSDNWNEAVSCVMRSFDLDHEQQCAWESFKQVMNEVVPGVQTAMSRILDALIKQPRIVSEDSFQSLTSDEVIQLVSVVYESSEPGFPTPGKISTLPLLCQLSMCLPEDLQLDKARLVFSSKGGQKNINDLNALLESLSQSTVLLISGSTAPGTHSSPSGKRIICGAYLPFEDSASRSQSVRSTLFQCEPKYQVCHGNIDCASSSLQGDPKTDSYALRLNAVEQAHSALIIDSQLRDGSLELPTESFSAAGGSVHFSVENLEVFDVTI